MINFMKIIPAILEEDFSNIKKKLEYLAFFKKKYNLNFDIVQIDLCDGKFVENKTWLPESENIKEIDEISTYNNLFNIEYHIMCEDQYKYFLELEKLKAKRVVVHIDNIFRLKDLENIIQRAKELLIKIIITSKLDFMIKNREDIVIFLNKNKNIDLQIMSIDTIGSQGNDFNEESLYIIKFFRKNFSKKDLYVQVDGSINEYTALKVKKAGADAGIVGSYLMKETNEMKFIYRFRNISNI